MNKIKILILGASSKVSEVLLRIFRPEKQYEILLVSSVVGVHDLYPTFEFKLYSILNESGTNYPVLKKIIFDFKPYYIVNFYGFSSISGCESNKQICREMNTHVVETLVSMCKVLDCHLITFSTEHVFNRKNGPYSELSLPEPSDYFGKSKLAAENVCKSIEKCSIIRSTSIVGLSNFGHQDYISKLVSLYVPSSDSFYDNIIFSNPVFSEDLALLVYKLILSNKCGIFNCGGKDWLSDYSAMKLITDSFSLDNSSIFPKENTVKRKCGLITLRIETEFFINPSSFDNILTTMRYHQNLKANFNTTNYY